MYVLLAVLTVVVSYSKRKLVPWLRLILRNQTILETMYETWSYAVTQGNNVQADELRYYTR
jgi:hypothetical protein